MHTDKLQEKKPTGDGNPTAGHTDGSILIGAVLRIKAAMFRSASWLPENVLHVAHVPEQSERAHITNMDDLLRGGHSDG